MSKDLQRRVGKVEGRQAGRGLKHLTDEQIELRIACLARDILRTTMIEQLREEFAGMPEALAFFEAAEMERARHAAH